MKKLEIKIHIIYCEGAAIDRKRFLSRQKFLDCIPKDLITLLRTKIKHEPERIEFECSIIHGE